MPTEIDFVSEYSRWENEVYRFISSLVPHAPDADELMQETAKTLWMKYFESEEPIGSFKAWACQIAFYEVLRYRKSMAKHRCRFSAGVIEQLSETREEHDHVLAERRSALAKCLPRLESSDLKLLRIRYGIEVDQQQESLAGSQEQPITNAMSKRLQRVRSLLMQCVERRLAEGM